LAKSERNERGDWDSWNCSWYSTGPAVSGMTPAGSERLLVRSVADVPRLEARDTSSVAPQTWPLERTRPLESRHAEDEGHLAGHRLGPARRTSGSFHRKSLPTPDGGSVWGYARAKIHHSGPRYRLLDRV
jgi:hypothetical protein